MSLCSAKNYGRFTFLATIFIVVRLADQSAGANNRQVAPYGQPEPLQQETQRTYFKPRQLLLMSNAPHSSLNNDFDDDYGYPQREYYPVESHRQQPKLLQFKYIMKQRRRTPRPTTLARTTITASITTSTAPATTSLSSTTDTTSNPLSCAGTSFFYHLGTNNFTYSAASDACTGNGSRLVVVKSQYVSDCLTKFIQDAGAQKNNFWIGLQRTGDGESTFKWSDGAILNSGDFTNWVLGEPNNAYNSQNCVYLWGTHSTLQWDDMYCSGEDPATTVNGYVCEPLNSIA